MEISRRDFINTASVALAATGVTTLAHAEEPAQNLTVHKLPELKYAYNALEPHIDARTMELHHSKHHKAYVDGLNKAEQELAKARSNGDFSLIEYWSKKAAFHGGGHYLHSLFWSIMSPSSAGGGSEPSGVLADMIRRDFGSVEAFRKQFTAAAVAVEGSGWAILHARHDDNKLIILQAENQHKLSPWGSTPVLCLDVWEHAYYLKYQNKRAEYVNAWWNVVNWKQIQENCQMIMR